MIICVATHIRKRVAKLSPEVLDRPAFISAASEKQLWLLHFCYKKFWNITLEAQTPSLLITLLMLILGEISLMSGLCHSDIFSSGRLSCLWTIKISVFLTFVLLCIFYFHLLFFFFWTRHLQLKVYQLMGTIPWCLVFSLYFFWLQKCSDKLFVPFQIYPCQCGLVEPYILFNIKL